jgi:hypothetical protein
LNLLPYHSEILVSAFSKKEVLSQLNKVTVEVNYLDRRSQQDRDSFFNGIIGQSGFRISKVVNRGDTFLPLLLGKVEETPRGCILFLQYKLFPGAIFFLSFWTVILLAAAVFYILATPNYLYATAAIGLTAINYFIALFFFNRQVKSSREIFHKHLNFQMKD